MEILYKKTYYFLNPKNFQLKKLRVLTSFLLFLFREHSRIGHFLFFEILIKKLEPRKQKKNRPGQKF